LSSVRCTFRRPGTGTGALIPRLCRWLRRIAGQCGRARGLAIDSFLAVSIPETSHLITWRIGELGFDMHLSGQVPGEIGRALKEWEARSRVERHLSSVDLWAVHPGGRSILDSVEKGLELPADALAASRSVLAQYGNMSSATVMFVLQKIMRGAKWTTGLRHVLWPWSDR
jgi:alpha-pyrone synthase